MPQTPDDLFHANLGLASSAARRAMRLPLVRKRLTHEEARSAATAGLWHACLGYDPDRGKFSTYAWSCCYTAVLGDLDREVRARPAWVRALEPGDDVDASVGPDQEVIGAVRRALARLSPRLRAAVRGVMAGLSQVEIARRAGVTKQAIGLRLERAYAILARKLEAFR
jgi:RNA polymerase sigma factor (sigma-70 family)